MTASRETAAKNAQRSTGPKTQEGKTISSRNATQHGLLSNEPPLIGTEDHAALDSILTGLVEEYEPRGPLEFHLTAQIAMCILRQHRAWRAEAVAGERAVAQETLSRHYPENQPLSLGIPGIDTRAATHPEVLKEERRVLGTVRDALEMAWYDAPKTPAALRRWCERPVGEDSREANLEWLTRYLREAVSAAIQGYPDPARPSPEPGPHPLKTVAVLLHVLEEITPENADTARHYTQDAVESVAQRVREINTALQEIERLQSVAKRAHSITEDLDLIGRYEARNNRQLRQAMEQLQQLQAARLGAAAGGGFGSFGSGRPSRLKVAQ